MLDILSDLNADLASVGGRSGRKVGHVLGRKWVGEWVRGGGGEINVNHNLRSRKLHLFNAICASIDLENFAGDLIGLYSPHAEDIQRSAQGNADEFIDYLQEIVERVETG